MAQGRRNNWLEPLWFRNAKIVTDLARKMVVDFGVPRDRAALPGNRVVPPGVAGTLAKNLTAVSREMPQEITAFHTAIGNSS
jgi:hypothetical protein